MGAEILRVKPSFIESFSDRQVDDVEMAAWETFYHHFAFDAHLPLPLNQLALSHIPQLCLHGKVVFNASRVSSETRPFIVGKMNMVDGHVYSVDQLFYDEGSGEIIFGVRVEREDIVYNDVLRAFNLQPLTSTAYLSSKFFSPYMLDAL